MRIDPIYYHQILLLALIDSLVSFRYCLNTKRFRCDDYDIKHLSRTITQPQKTAFMDNVGCKHRLIPHVGCSHDHFLKILCMDTNYTHQMSAHRKKHLGYIIWRCSLPGVFFRSPCNVCQGVWPFKKLLSFEKRRGCMLSPPVAALLVLWSLWNVSLVLWWLSSDVSLPRQFCVHSCLALYYGLVGRVQITFSKSKKHLVAVKYPFAQCSYMSV